MKNFRATAIFIILVALQVSSNFCLRNHHQKHRFSEAKEQSTNYSLSNPVKYTMNGKVSGNNMEGKIYKSDGSVFASWYLFKGQTPVYNGYTQPNSNFHYLVA